MSLRVYSLYPGGKHARMTMPNESREGSAQAGVVGSYPPFRVILVNDADCAFDRVVASLERHIPGMTNGMAWSLTIKVHNEGFAVIWVGPREVAEHYCILLMGDGLTPVMAPAG